MGVEVIRSRIHVDDILTMFNFDVVLDIGANVGQFAEYIRSQGYDGRIISFEPVKGTYEKLKQKIKKGQKWMAVNAGLGQDEMESIINVTESSVYSSLLYPHQDLIDFAGNAIRISAREKVAIHTLDSQYPIYVQEKDSAFLKIDTQGFEKQVLLGGTKSLDTIKGVQVELSLNPLYNGEAPLAEIATLLEAKGFKMALLDPVTYDRQNGILLQVDCIFLKNNFGPFAKNYTKK